MALLKSGLVPPRRTPGFVHRKRLDAYLENALAHKVTVVHASAGAGKSTLIAQWYDILTQRGMLVIWLSIDRHTVNHIGQILSAVREVVPEIGDALSERLAEAKGGAEFLTSEIELTALIDGIVAFGQPMCIMMDDTHFIPDGESALFRRFVGRLPSNVSLILAMRNLPDLPLARMRARGELFELDQTHLRFTRDETRDLLAASSQYKLSENDIENLQERTEGWATGLRLAVLSLKGSGDAGRMIASFSGHKRVVSDFFSEDVVSALTKELQDFLLAACFLDKFSADLCDYVTGRDDSTARIAEVEAAGLFLMRLEDDGGWYRFHSLFAEFLSRRASGLMPEAAAEVHRRAARWYFDRRQLSEALDHAEQSGDNALIAELLEQCSEDVVYNGKLYYVSDLAKRIGPDLLNQNPGILLSAAWMEIRGMKFEAAQHMMDQAEQVIKMRALPSDDRLRDILLHRRIMLAAAKDEFEAVEEMAGRLLRKKDALNPYLVCNLYGQSIRAQRCRIRFDEFERNEALARRALTASDYKFAFVAQQAIVGRAYYSQARGAAAERAFQFGLEQAIDFAGPGSALAALPALSYANLLYDRNELHRAKEMLALYLPKARVFSFSDELLDGLLLAPRLLSVENDFEGALGALDEAKSVAAELGLATMTERVRLGTIRLLLQHFHTDRALLLETEPSLPTLSFKPTSSSTVVDEARAEARVRLNMASGRLDDAATIVQRWRSFCQGRAATQSFLQWSLLHAQLAVMQGDRRLAQRSLRDALVAATESRSIRMFLDEGVRIQQLLEDSYGSGPRTDQPVDRFAYELLGYFDNRSPSRTMIAEEPDEMGPAIEGEITGRELEILNFVAAGLRNREIGDRLGLTEGSVKWYMQRIYDKMGTRRRSLAVEHARQMGFLH
jgi:LuxR family maltose regulon positive regulatory protein